jgi:hypothetical protein
MKLTFNRNEVEKLVTHTKNAEEHMPLYGMAETQRAGLWLVGDEGVYLMSNAKDHLRRDESDPKDKRSFVAYAKQCDPNKLEFDEWWDNKRASFGGDDGAEFIPIEDIEGGLENSKVKDGDLTIDVTPQSIGVLQWREDPEYDAKVKKYRELQEKVSDIHKRMEKLFPMNKPTRERFQYVKVWNDLMGKIKRARKIDSKIKHMESLVKKMEAMEKENLADKKA